MKRFLPLLLFLAPPVAAQDTGWSIRSFDAAYTVGLDRTITVVETIDVDFGSLERHGIYRDIQVSYQKTVDAGLPISAGRIRVDLDRLLVADGDGQPLPTSVERGDRVRVRIGDPNRTISGRQTYVISYSLERGLGFFDDHDELYWQATGTDWPVPILEATATVSVPAGDRNAAGWGAWCYAGWYESSDSSRCTAAVAGEGTFRFAVRGLDPGEGLTVVAGFPKGIVPEPTALEETGRVVGLWWPVGLPFLFLGFMAWLWNTRGRDPAKRSVVPDWRVPTDLRPGQAGTLWDQSADMDDVVAIILDLGVRGFLRIREVPPDGMLAGVDDGSFTGKLLRTLGITKTDWLLERIRVADEGPLTTSESLVLDGIFDRADFRQMSDLNNDFYKQLPKIHEALYEEAVEKGLFTRNPGTVRSLYLGGGLVVSVLGVAIGVVTQNVLLAGALLLSGVIVAAFAQAMPARTARGARKWQHLRGLEEYVRRAEKMDLEARHAPEKTTELFEEILPYAVALDVSDLWVAQFEPVLASQSPNWYVGSHPGHFSAGSFSRSLSGFRTAATRTLGSSPGSSSGSGGGGSVGGGGGGGGGGSW